MDFQCFIYIICTFLPMKIVDILPFYLVIAVKAKTHYSRNILNRFFILFSTCTIYIYIYITIFCTICFAMKDTFFHTKKYYFIF